MGDTCKSCGAKVLWAKSESGRPMIFDAEPVENGTWFIKKGLAYFIDKKNYIDQEVSEKLYVSHFATCPNAKQHRRK